jgi:hypothetical protein
MNQHAKKQRKADLPHEPQRRHRANMVTDALSRWKSKHEIISMKETAEKGKTTKQNRRK